MLRIGILAAVAAAAVLAVAQPADAQSLGDRLKKKAKEAAERQAEERAAKRAAEAATAAMNKAEDVVKCLATDKPCQDKAKAEGKKVEIVTNPAAVTGGASAGAPARAAPAGAAPAGAAAAPPAADASSGAASAKPGEGAWVNFDFVPGDRAIFVDDFTKDNVGDFPKRLELVDGNMEVAELKSGGRMLRVTSWPGKFTINLPEPLPERFTIEFDATPGYGSNFIILRFADKATDDVRFRLYGGKGSGGVFGAKHQTAGSTLKPIADGEIYRARIMADGKYVKVYMNDTRISNIPNADIGRSNKIEVEIPGKEDNPVFFGNLSIMAGGKKLYDALAAKGRVATQGIYFDVGSDRIRPESTPTLKEIGQMLKEHADLKLTIEGHTDNVGGAAPNQALSDKRAASVRQVLVGTYGIEEARLSAKGFGATKPVASNDTPEGRQQNRRVELVKM